MAATTSPARPTITVDVDLDVGYPTGTAGRILSAGTGSRVRFVTTVNHPDGCYDIVEAHVVQSGSWGKSPEVAEIMDDFTGDADHDQTVAERLHAIPFAEVTLTADGRPADVSRWHAGDSADVVAYERWTAEGRVGHGFVDAESRRLVQAG